MRAGSAVAVTGAAGFVGSHVVDSLVAEGSSVVACDNLRAGKWSNLDAHGGVVTRVELDVRDAAAVDALVAEHDLTSIVHLAANADVPASVNDPAYDHDTNAGGTFAVLDAVRRLSPTTRVVVASSAAVYGTPRSLPIDENAPLAPISPYGASKVAADAMARAFKETYGVQAVIARIFNTYGPRMPRYVVVDFLHKLQRDPHHLEIIGTGRQLRDLSYVSDTAAGLLTLVDGGEPGEAYNVCTGKSHTVTDVAKTMIDLLGLDAELSFTGVSWPGDVEEFEGDPRKLSALGHRASVSLSEGLAHVIEWFEATFGPVACGRRPPVAATAPTTLDDARGRA
ncbi:MAG: UDP-glucose 4-epimerase [Acidimicrobiaceae bacterium]|jgi:UDP-glucose 4-epimerase